MNRTVLINLKTPNGYTEMWYTNKMTAVVYIEMYAVSN